MIVNYFSFASFFQQLSASEPFTCTGENRTTSAHLKEKSVFCFFVNKSREKIKTNKKWSVSMAWYI